MDTGKSFHIHTFGCQMNVLDSEKAAGLLVAAGWRKADRPQDADLILYNTCCVREKPTQKVFSYLGQTLALKSRRPGLIVGVMGCVAQQQGWKIMNAFTGLDLVIGTRKIHRLTDHLRDLAAGRAARCVDVDMDDDPLPVEVDTILRETPFRAFVTIMEGCDNYCAYCIVPHTRGRERSRPSRRILDEIRRLVTDGAVEVMLLGQNVNSYRDPDGGAPDFATLLEQAAAVPGLRRLRFTTSHPKDFNERLLRVMLEHPPVCNQLHLPAQSGSSRILAAMNRKYTRADYLGLLDLIRQSGRYISLSSDFIVGFPGETDDDFEETVSLLHHVRYDSIFSFMYSPRPGTPAFDQPDSVPRPVKQARLARLQAAQEAIQREANGAEVGTVREVLVDGRGRETGQLSSRTTENKIVHFVGDPALIGRFCRVRVTGASAHSLRGELAGE
jgi:tRNA-2-methylthio-N6-dimethylallyladenosine synthase